jgi:hypothetical protein
MLHGTIDEEIIEWFVGSSNGPGAGATRVDRSVLVVVHGVHRTGELASDAVPHVH